MSQPRLFLSHSSHDQALSEGVAAELRTPGPGGHKGFDVLLDVDCLKAGEEWPAQLHSMMAYAQAGLLLFTPAAMKRPDWVRKEAYILTWRRSQDPAFKVFYALLDGVAAEDLTTHGFDPAHLRLIQSLKSTKPDPAAIAAEVKALAPSIGNPKTLFDELVIRVEQPLRGLGEPQLQDLAAKLGAPPARWTPAGVKPEIAAIATRILVGELGDLRRLTALVNHLRSFSLSSEALDNMLRWVAPYWLAPETAGRLGAVVHDLWVEPDEASRGSGLAAINGRKVAKYTAERIIEKACPFDYHFHVADFEGPADRADADFYTNRICDWLRARMRDGYGGDNAEVMAELGTRPPFLFVPIRTPDEDTLRTLRARFPKILFLVWTGDRLATPGYSLPIVALEPEIDLEREQTEYGEYFGARSVIRRRYEG